MDRHTAEAVGSGSPHFVRTLSTYSDTGVAEQRCSLAKVEKASSRDGLSQAISSRRRDIN